MHISSRSAWNWKEITHFLNDTVVPCRFSCLTPEGFPHVTSLWFLLVDQTLLFSVQKNMALNRWLADSPKCGFEVAPDAPPYRGVRGRGTGHVYPAEDGVLKAMIDRYIDDANGGLAKWLLSRHESELTIRLQLEWLTSWDYGARM
ncbi:MAG: pyridoxamine 5'-phosphate oxidase family protein [Pseudomonadota bacterium]